MKAVLDLEPTEASDRYFDYCLWEYSPVADPQHKLRSINLLHQSFASAGMDARAYALVQAVRAGIGHGNTVWGVKQQAGVLSWELYFYDYGRRQRARSITRLLEIIRPFIPCDIRVNEARDYFMFSVDINSALLSATQSLQELQMYIGNVGSSVSSGICYTVTPQTITMKNFYFFFDARTESRQIVDKVISSAYLDVSRFDVDSVLWPELRRCKTIVVANKRDHDGIYFSRITLEQLLVFLRRLDYPQSTVDFVEGHREQLNHLLYDVGFDYRMEDGVLRILKSAYYGVF